MAGLKALAPPADDATGTEDAAGGEVAETVWAGAAVVPCEAGAAAVTRSAASRRCSSACKRVS